MTLTLANRLRPAAGLIIAMLLALLVAVVTGHQLHYGAPFAVPVFGAVTLAQAATLSQNDLQRGVLEIFVRESPVLDRIPLKDIEGNAYAYNEEGTLPGVEFRAVNGSYAESTGTVNQKSETLTILGGDADVDTFIQATRSNLNDQRATQTAMKVKAAAYKWGDAFFNGDVAVDANSFDGLKKRLTGAQVLDAATNGLVIVGNGGTDVQTFLDKLDELIAAVPGTQALYMNTLVRAKILAALRRINIQVESVGRLPEPLVQGTFGAMGAIPQERLPLYNGIPMIDAGLKADNSLILPQTETQGTAVDASSIYAVRFGEDEADQSVTGLYNTQNGTVQDRVFAVKDLGEQQAKPAFRTRVEGFVGLAVFGGKAAGRLRGVRAA